MPQNGTQKGYDMIDIRNAAKSIIDTGLILNCQCSDIRKDRGLSYYFILITPRTRIFLLREGNGDPHEVGKIVFHRK